MAKATVTVGTKFSSGNALVAFVEQAYGVAFIDTKVIAFYEANKNMVFSHSGLLRALKAL